MKKILALTAVIAGLFAIIPPPEAEASHYRSQILGSCGHCHRNILSYYRPVRFLGTRAVFGWVPSYHTNCGYRSYQRIPSLSFRNQYGRPSYHNFGYRYGISPRVRTTRSFSSPLYRGRSSGYCR